MYTTAAHIVSIYSGLPYTTFVSERIFKPLGMQSTTFTPSEAVRSGKMSQAWTLTGRRIPQWFDDEVAGVIAGAGGVISSAADIVSWQPLHTASSSNTNHVKAKWVRYWVDNDMNVTGLPKSAVLETTVASAIVSGVPLAPDWSLAGYGMGWVRSSIKGVDVGLAILCISLSC